MGVVGEIGDVTPRKGDWGVGGEKEGGEGVASGAIKMITYPDLGVANGCLDTILGPLPDWSR